MKTCSQCGETKPATKEYFYTVKTSKDGLRSYCKVCERERAKKYKEANKDKVHAQYKKYYAKDKERYVQNARRWQAENEERAKEIARNFRKSEEGKKKLKQYQQNRRSKLPEAGKAEWHMCLTYFNFSCSYCGISESDAKKTYGEFLHKEHLVNDGRNDLRNLVPACKSCNCEKHVRSFNNWYNPDNPKYDRDRYLRIYYWIRYFSKSIS